MGRHSQTKFHWLQLGGAAGTKRRVKEETAPICFHLKLARRHQAHERSSSFFNYTSTGSPAPAITAHSFNPAALPSCLPTPASWEGASRKSEGQLEAFMSAFVWLLSSVQEHDTHPVSREASNL